MLFKTFANNKSNLQDFSNLTEQQKVNEAAQLCKLSPLAFAAAVDAMPDDVRTTIDTYIPNPLFLVEDSVFDRTNLIIPRRKEKYTPVFIDLLNDNNGSLKIHPIFVPKYGTNSIAIKDITNRKELLDFLHKKIPSNVVDWPAIKTKNGLAIKIYHLTKSGQFRTVATAETDTNIKEGLVSVLYNCLQKHHITSNTVFTNDNLGNQIAKILKGADDSLGESAKTVNTINSWLKVQAGAPNKIAANILQQVLSQASAIYSEYPKAKLDRDQIFNTIRNLGAAITMFPKDKWNPGDIYVVLPGALTRISAIQKQIAQEDNAANKLQLLNDLFVHDWGSTNGALVSVSLKLAEAQGGKAKDFLRSISSEPEHYNITPQEQKMPLTKCKLAVMAQRKWLKYACAEYKGDVNIVYEGTVDVSSQLASNPKRLREKYACLKLINFMLSRRGIQNMDDTIVAAIGYGLSLAGVNPTFFKLVANKAGSPAVPQKFSAGGAVTLHPIDKLSDATIRILDNNTSNNVQIICKIEKGENICDVQMMARSLGYTQATLEITRIKCTHAE